MWLMGLVFIFIFVILISNPTPKVRFLNWFWYSSPFVMVKISTITFLNLKYIYYRIWLFDMHVFTNTFNTCKYFFEFVFRGFFFMEYCYFLLPNASCESWFLVCKSLPVYGLVDILNLSQNTRSSMAGWRK